MDLLLQTLVSSERKSANLNNLTNDKINIPKNDLKKLPRCFQCFKFKTNDQENWRPCNGGCQTMILFCSDDCKAKSKIRHKECCHYIKKIRKDLSELEEKNNAVSHTFMRDAESQTWSSYLERCLQNRLGRVLKATISKHNLCDVMTNFYKTCINYNDPEILNNSGDKSDENITLSKYVWKLQCLSYALWHLAEKSHNFQLYEEHLKLVTEILRWSASGFCVMQCFLVMSLLNMNRDDEAYNVIKFRMVTFSGTSYKDFNKIVELVSKLKPGEWLQTSNQDKTESDLYNVSYTNGIVDSPWFGTHGTFLTALLIIKYKIVLKMEKNKADFQTFIEATNQSEKSTPLWTLRNSFPHIYEKISMMILGYSSPKFNSILFEQRNQLRKMIDLIVEQRFAKFLIKDFEDELNGLQTYDFQEYLSLLDSSQYKTVIGARRCLLQFPKLIELLRNHMSEVDGESDSENDSYDDFDPQDSIYRHSTLQNNQDLISDNQSTSDNESEISSSENVESSESESEPEKSLGSDDSEHSEKDENSDNDDVQTEPPFKKQKLLEQD